MKKMRNNGGKSDKKKGVMFIISQLIREECFLPSCGDENLQCHYV